ncbi:DUF3180 domain-containing protein [Segniliparus rotundus]|uniref:DUF3180 domain-containing protein n=1 Tax=Segniliparus rotundus TaxID=286802 RepID=UPI001651AC83|nr:DUF3180 domain-containing protein [Segniliparus rotundus]
MACVAVGALWALCGPGITTMPQRLSSAAPLMLLGLMEAGLGSYLKSRVRGNRIGLGPGLTPPVFVARVGRLASATVFMGAAFAGFWGSLAVYSFLRAHQLLAAERNLPADLFGVAGAATLVAGAFWSRRCCRAPGDGSAGSCAGGAAP